MLVQDMLTGYLHEVPDRSFGGNLAGYGFPYGSPSRQARRHFGQAIYDGFGNPLGLPILAALAPLAAKAVGVIAPLVAKAAPIITKALPIVSSFAPMLRGGAPPSPLRPAAMIRSVPAPQAPFAPGAPMAFDPARAPAMSAMPPSVVPAMPFTPGLPPHHVVFRRRRRGRRRVVIRRAARPVTAFAPPPTANAFAPPPPPVIQAPVRTEPANTVSGYGYYGGLRGYGW